MKEKGLVIISLLLFLWSSPNYAQNICAGVFSNQKDDLSIANKIESALLTLKPNEDGRYNGPALRIVRELIISFVGNTPKQRIALLKALHVKEVYSIENVNKTNEIYTSKLLHHLNSSTDVARFTSDLAKLITSGKIKEIHSTEMPSHEKIEISKKWLKDFESIWKNKVAEFRERLNGSQLKDLRLLLLPYVGLTSHERASILEKIFPGESSSFPIVHPSPEYYLFMVLNQLNSELRLSPFINYFINLHKRNLQTNGDGGFDILIKDVSKEEIKSQSIKWIQEKEKIEKDFGHNFTDRSAIQRIALLIEKDLGLSSAEKESFFLRAPKNIKSVLQSLLSPDSISPRQNAINFVNELFQTGRIEELINFLTQEHKSRVENP